MLAYTENVRGVKSLGKGKNKKRSAFLPPTRKPANPYVKNVTYEELQRQYNAEMTQASNNAFNLSMSACLIASKDMGLSNEQVQELSQRAFGVLDDVADELATIDSMMKLVESFGVEIYKTAQDKTAEQGNKLANKTAVFDLLERGIEEIDDILKIAKSKGFNIDYRDACTWRWEFNSIKYWEDGQMATSKMTEVMQMLKNGVKAEDVMQQADITKSTFNTYKSYFNQMYTEDGQMTDKMRECWDGFKEGMTVPEVIKATGYGKMFVFNAYNEWLLVNERQKSKEERKNIEEVKEVAKRAANVKVTEVLSTSEFTEKFFADMEEEQNEVKEEIARANEGNQAGEGVEEGREEQGEKAQDARASIKTQENQMGNGASLVEVNKETEEAVKDMESRRTKLKKIVKLVAIEGEFTTYKPVGPNSFDMEIDGQVITLSREQMKDFGEELIAVAMEEF